MSMGSMDEEEAALLRDPSRYLLYVERARRLQSQTIGNALSRAGHFLVRCLSYGYRRIVNASRERQTIVALSRLEDGMLRDIGIERYQIAATARALVAHSLTEPRHEIANALCSPAELGDAANDSGSHPMAA